jgi:hypothetical protein
MRQCKSEHQGFKKAKERTWDNASLGVKTLREIMLQKAKRKHGTVSLRKESLKNQKEDF